MLRKYFIILFLLVVYHSFAQDKNLANIYFRNGEFEKALNIYQDIYAKSTNNSYYFNKIIQCWQGLEEYEKAAEFINKRMRSFPKQTYLWVELGYNLDLQYKSEEAKVYYDKAAKALKKKPSAGYQIAKSFQDKNLLDYALESYLLMKEANSTSNYNYQIAAIYGEKGAFEEMFTLYLDMLQQQARSLTNIQRYIGKYISDDAQDQNNRLFRKLLIKRLQENPKDEWNKLLSWLYLQQRDFSKALQQEIAVHKRSETDLDAVIDIGTIAFESGDYEVTNSAFQYVLNHTSDSHLQIRSKYYILESQKKRFDDLSAIDSAYQSVFKEFGKGSNTLKIQVSYADFLTFNKNQPERAIEFLQASLKNKLSKFQKAEVKLQLADIMVFTGKYNQALINYSQVQIQLKNHVLAQEARYKVARTSYFKGDFDWANTQLKVLKRGTTKLIANDALDLSLLIDDNIAQDSVRTALKSYAKADLLSYQNKDEQAIDTLHQILLKHKGHPIEDEALFKQAQLYEKQKQFELAEQNYLNILDLEQNDILIDDALYNLAELYDKELNKPEKAKEFFKKIVLEQASSIYLIPARKRFRQLRGDILVP